MEEEEKPEPKKRGRKKKVVNLDQETEQSKEPSPMSSKASTRKNGRRNVKNEELSMPSKSTRVTGKLFFKCNIFLVVTMFTKFSLQIEIYFFQILYKHLFKNMAPEILENLKSIIDRQKSDDFSEKC